MLKNTLSTEMFFAAFFDVCFVNKLLSFRKLFVEFFLYQPKLFFVHIPVSYDFVLSVN